MAVNVREDLERSTTLMNGLSYLVLLIAVLSLIVISAKMVMASMRRNSPEAAEGVTQIPWVLLSVCMIFMAVPFISLILPDADISGNVSPANFTKANDDNFRNAITDIIAWGKGIVTVLAVLGLLWAAGRMALGKFGGSDLIVEGVGGITWTIFGISLMLLSSVTITSLAGS